MTKYTIPYDYKKYNLKVKESRVFGLLSDVKVCRVFKVKYLRKMICKKQNTLVQIEKWEDPFEAFLLKQKVHDGNNVIDISSLYKNYYGQCWSLNEKETDATWRIYSPKKDGVLVKTTLGKLWDGFYDPSLKFASIEFSIGKVEYHEEKDIKSTFQRINFGELIDTKMSELSKTLFIKRREFEHENEVRIIFNDLEGKSSEELYNYPIILEDLFVDMIADPRMEDN